MVKYIQLGIRGLSEERKKLINSANMKLKAAVVMILVILIIIFSDQVFFRGKTSNTRKRAKEVKRNTKERK